MSLHREISHWLRDFKLISSDCPTLQANSELKDLIAVIRDGVILCQLVHSLDPTSVDMTRVICTDSLGNGDDDGRAVSDFVCRNNIFLFLHAIVSNFGLSMDEHFFDPEDLYLCKDIRRVFATLSALSHSPQVRKSGVTGFPKKEKLLASRMQAEMNDYEALNHMFGDAETEYVYESFSNTRKAKQPANIYDNNKYESIYQTIFPPKPPRLSISQTLTSALGPSSSSRKQKRLAPVNELITTEDIYLGNLISVRDKYRDKLNLMVTMDKEVVFCRLDELILLHSDILFELRTGKNPDIGMIFLHHANRMRTLYGLYCVNLPIAVERLEALSSANPALRKQLMECQLTTSQPTFSLADQLVVPFQRFLKYFLLLKAILKYTDDDAVIGQHHRQHLVDAADAMKESCDAVNERKREQEEIEQQMMADIADMKLVENVSATIKLMKLEKGRKLLEYGRLRKAGEVSSYSNGSSGYVGDYAFLFDMVLILCYKPKWLQHRYRFRDALKLKDLFLEQPIFLHHHDSFSGSSGDNAFMNVIRLFSRVDPSQFVLTLVTRTEQEREAWFNGLLMAMDTVCPSENLQQGHVIQLSTFSDPSDCSHCQKRLSGCFFQGYRCLRCQASLHKSCLAERACLEVGCLKKSPSFSLPTALSESGGVGGNMMERSGSTLSLAASTQVADSGGKSRSKNSSEKVLRLLQDYQSNVEREMQMTPLEEQPWYAGDLPAKTAGDRLEQLPVGTFLVRIRSNGNYALMLKSPEMPKGVKSMKIETDKDTDEYYLSHARKFKTIQNLIIFYRNRDLTENFNYESLRGVTLKTPYKDI